MSYWLSEPDTCSIIPPIKLGLVHYEEGQEGLVREQKRQSSSLRKAWLTGDRMKSREKSVGVSGGWQVLRREEMRLQWGQF